MNDQPRPARCLAPCRRAFRKRVRIALDRVSHLVKKLVERDKGRASHVPVRLLHLPMQIYHCDEVLIEQPDGFRTNVLGERVVGIPHVQCANPVFESGEITLNLAEGSHAPGRHLVREL
jgi:hypothetical protein